ncbi:MAG: DUF4406 domain-containing protein [Candidatus Omnitrophica bacterium]|nr:DUF4406 domain-containing protein [Candidatus Omnitrophota bacterium]
MKIYIAGPYSDKSKKQRQKNTEYVVDVGIKIFLKGHFPYIPHLTHFVDLQAKKTKINIGWKDYMSWHDVWLTTCDAFLYLGSSKGADRELKKAKKLGKKIFYSLDEIYCAKKNS